MEMPKVRSTEIQRILLIGALILLLQIPILQIQGLLRDRQSTKHQAEYEIAQTSGGEQLINGPVIMVPYRFQQANSDGKIITHRDRAYLFPEELSVEGVLKTEPRYRGIFEIPTYNTSLAFRGTFLPALVRSNLTADQVDILWAEAKLGVGFADTVAIRDQATLKLNDNDIEFEPGSGGVPFLTHGIHASLSKQSIDPSKEMTFAFTVSLGGSQAISFLPSGKNTTVSLKSDWKDPSFNGAYLPVSRTVTDNGFEALWKIPDLARGFPRVLVSGQLISTKPPYSSEGSFGVRFLSLVDGHRMTDRTIKYDLLFIFLTFLAYYLFEIFTKFRIHPIQYLLIGGALTLFYLLLLSISEHTGFGIAYLVSSLSSIALVATYSKAILQKRQPAWVMPTVLGILYGFLYALLSDEDNALLLGSVGLTVTLGLVMYLTRKIDWYGLSESNHSALKSES